MTNKQILRDNSQMIQTKGAKMAINTFCQTLEPLDVCSGNVSKKLQEGYTRYFTQDNYQVVG